MGNPRPGYFKPAGPALLEFGELAPREFDLAVYIGAGLNNKEIAEKMGLRIESIRVMSSQIYDRLGLGKWGNSRTRLALLAYAEYWHV